MNLRKYVASSVIMILLVGGIWLITRPGELTSESLERRQALAPFTNIGSGQDSGESADIPDIIIHDPVPGSAIDLADLPSEVDLGDSQYQRWLKGEIVLEEEESFLTPDQEAELRKALADKGPNENIQAPTSALENLVLEDTFPGPDIRDCCASVSQAVVPPDPELAVGSNYLIAVVNIAFEIYNKQGQVVLQSTTFSSLFSGVSGCNVLGNLFDPNVLYDESTGRYFMGIASDSGYYCAAVSATSNPASTWYRYRFTTNATGGFFDYPHAGIGRDAIYLGANIFQCPQSNCPYREARVWAFNKSAMYANASTAVVERAVPGGTTSFTPQPANLHGYAQGTWPTTGPHYFIIDTNFNGSTNTVYAWSSPFSTNTFFSTGTYNLTTATGVSPLYPFATASQYGGSGRIQTNDWRPLDNEYRNGYLWTTNTITCNPGGGSVTCVRWAQINPSNGSIVQAGVLGSSSTYRYFGDLAANHCSDMAIGFTKSSANTYAGVWVAGRQSSDPPNTLQGETLMKAGETTYDAFDNSPFRWGDYTGFTSDPNGRDFWYLGQYSKNVSQSPANWGTYIGCFSVPSCSVPNFEAETPEENDTVSPPPPLLEGNNVVFLPGIFYNPVLPCGY
ncbi:MAG: hypothetical protein WAM60_23930 [Candidatus Promineifilaceae bacterium]